MRMNIQEAFKYLRDAIEWLFDELELNTRENEPTLYDMKLKLLESNPLKSNEELARYAVLRIIAKAYGVANVTENTPKEIDNILRQLFFIFGGDGPDAGMTLLTDEEYNDDSDLTLSAHLEALNLAAQYFELKERECEWSEIDLWDTIASIIKMEKPKLSVWITSVKRMTEALRETYYFEDLKIDNSLKINDELQDIFSVYRLMIPFERRK